MESFVYILVNVVSPIAQMIIAGAAIFALRQISISKQSIQIQSRRESIKYATELIKNYVSNLIPLHNQIDKIYSGKGWQSLEVNLEDFIAEEVKLMFPDVVRHCENSINLEFSDDKILEPTINMQNDLEAFSVPFVNGVADEEVAFNAIGETFCYTVSKYYFAYCAVRPKPRKSITNGFENTIILYNLWAPRMKKNELQNIAKATEEELASIKEKKIKAIGT